MEATLRYGAISLRPACRVRHPWAISKLSLRQQSQHYSKVHVKKSAPPPRLPSLSSTPKPLKYNAPSNHRPPPASSYPPPSSSGTLASIPRHRRTILLLGGALLAIPVLYITFLTTSLINTKPRSEHVPEDTSYMYNRNAASFDRDVNSMESLIGITSLRKKLCKQARGHVLESAVGTGRNTTAYPLTGGRITSVTMVDQSREMLDEARLKWPEQGNAWFIHALFRVADLSAPGTHLAPPARSGQAKFDTIVQTMGLCSTGRPVELLRNLGHMCAPSRTSSAAGSASAVDDTDNAGGRILLLEHGKSHYGWLNTLLDKAAPAHAERHGCWWNKDIGAIVRASGLEIVEQRRYHLGTTWWYVLRVPADFEADAAAAAAAQTAKDGAARAGSPWWRFWQQ